MPQHGELPSNQGIQATQALADPLSKNDPGQPSMRVPGTEHTLEESTMHRMLLEKEHKEQLLAKARREQESKDATRSRRPPASISTARAGAIRGLNESERSIHTPKTDSESVKTAAIDVGKFSQWFVWRFGATYTCSTARRQNSRTNKAKG